MAKVRYEGRATIVAVTSPSMRRSSANLGWVLDFRALGLPTALACVALCAPLGFAGVHSIPTGHGRGAVDQAPSFCGLTFQSGDRPFRATTRVDADGAYVSIASIPAAATPDIVFDTDPRPDGGREIVKLVFEGDQGQVDGIARATPGASSAFRQALWVQDSGRCVVRNLYEGIDLHVYSVAGGVEYDLIVHPGADPSTVSVRFLTDRSPELNAANQASLDVGAWRITHGRPVAFQGRDTETQAVPATQVVGDGAIAFEVGDYDRTKPLTIDPVISVSRVFGGWADSRIQQLKSAPDGSLYAYAETLSSDFPEIDSATVTNGGQNQSVVLKLDPVTLAPQFVVPIGWRSAQLAPYPGHDYIESDRVEGFAVGPDGSAYAAAYYAGNDFPVTNGVYFGGAGTKYIFRVSPQGTLSRAFGPLDPAIKTIRAIAVDPQSRIYVTGRAAATLATTPGAAIHGSTLGGQDAPFLAVLDSIQQRVLVSTFLTVPGSRTGTHVNDTLRNPVIDGLSTGYSIAIDSDGSAIVVGQATYRDMPATPGALDTSDPSYRDAFVLRVSANGTSIPFVARLGGADEDRATDVGVGSDGTVVVVGKTLTRLSTTPIATTAGVFQTSVDHAWYLTLLGYIVPWEEGFITVLSSSGNTRLAAARVGAHGGNLHRQAPLGIAPMPMRLAFDPQGNLLVAGATEKGSSLPVAQPLVPTATLDDSLKPFLLKVNQALSTLAYATPFGGVNGFGFATGIASGATGVVYVAGYTISPQFPIVNSEQAGRELDRPRHVGFVAKILDAPAPLSLVATPSPSSTGSSTQLTAVFADSSISGEVEFQDSGVTVATVPLLGGIAQANVVLPVGVRQLTATIRGGGLWNGFVSPTVYHESRQMSAAP